MKQKFQRSFLVCITLVNNLIESNIQRKKFFPKIFLCLCYKFNNLIIIQTKTKSIIPTGPKIIPKILIPCLYKINL